MKEFKLTNKFTVFNNKYLKNLSEDEQNTLFYLLEKMQHPNNFYYVVNSDEPYADQIFEIIKQGEFDKQGGTN